MKRKDKALPFRITFTIIIILLDLLVIPQILLVPIYVKQGTFAYFHWSFFGGITVLPKVKSVWLWLQPAAAGAIAWLWLTGRSLVNIVYTDDLPQPAGHGQHGTARWMTDAEIDRYFSTHKF